MITKNNIASNTDVPSLIRLGNRPSVAGATLFMSMKMIEDLGYLYPNEKSTGKRKYAIYECPFCRKHFRAAKDDVRRGDTKSCGCYKFFDIGLFNKTHGLSHTRLYGIWYNMIQRCYNTNSKLYKYYGARGIRVCNEWKNDFMFFYTWAMGHGYSDYLEIDRADNDGNYEPSNCRWVDHATNMRNRGRNKNNTSQYTGVSKKRNKWRARLCIGGREFNLGVFDTPKEAAITLNDYILKNNIDHKLNII